MKILKCDLCDHEVRAGSFNEWMKNLQPHYLRAHADVINDPNNGPEQMQKWMNENKERFEEA